jgi:hypothetical protein
LEVEAAREAERHLSPTLSPNKLAERESTVAGNSYGSAKNQLRFRVPICIQFWRLRLSMNVLPASQPKRHGKRPTPTIDHETAFQPCITY